MDSPSNSSLLSNKLIEDTYKLALKFFVTKEVQKSWIIISTLYQKAINEFKKGLISQKLLIKVISLYLVEIGINLQKSEDKLMEKNLKNKTILKNITSIFGTNLETPDEILYSYYLIFVTNPRLIDNLFYSEFDKLYQNYPSDSESKFYKKLVDLYVFEILTSGDLFDRAKLVIDSNDVYLKDRENAKLKLKQIETNKDFTRKVKEQEKLDKLKKDQEEQKKKDQLALSQKQKQLDYVKLNELTKNKPRDLPQKSNQSQLQLLKTKIQYLLSITGNYLKHSSPLILAILALIFLSTKFVNFKTLNIKEKLKQTVGMAFKVTYL